MSRLPCTLFLVLAVGVALLVDMPRRAGADPRSANCRPNRATCTANEQCCSGTCTAGLCVTPTTMTTTTSSTTSTTLRFVDNGDGTVTDNGTGLQWEQKVAGSGCLHCVNDLYTWTASNGGTAPDGTAFTSFLNTLNGGATGVGNCVSSDGLTQTGGFNDHCDWRLPTIAELQTILDRSQGSCGGGSGPCIDPVFGPTSPFTYWSATTFAGNATSLWLMVMSEGDGHAGADVGGKFSGFGLGNSVRAVRGGS